MNANTPPTTPRRGRARQSPPSSPSTPSTTFTATPIRHSTSRPTVFPTRKRKSEDDDKERVYPLMYLDRLGGSTDISKTSGLTLTHYLEESERISRLPLILTASQHPFKHSHPPPTPNTDLIKSIAARVHTAQTCFPYLPSKVNQGRDEKSKGQVFKLISTVLRSYGGDLEGLGRRGKPELPETEATSEMDIWSLIHERGLPKDIEEADSWMTEWTRIQKKDMGSRTLIKAEREVGRTALGRKIKKTKLESRVSVVESTSSHTRITTTTIIAGAEPEPRSPRNPTTIQSSLIPECVSAQSLSSLTHLTSTTNNPSKKKRQRSAHGSGQSNTIGWTASKVSIGSGSVKSGRSGLKGIALEDEGKHTEGKDDEEFNERVPIVFDVDDRQLQTPKELAKITTPPIKPSESVPSIALPEHTPENLTAPLAQIHPDSIATSLYSPGDAVKLPADDGNLGDDEMEPTQTDEETMAGNVAGREVVLDTLRSTVEVAAEDEQEETGKDIGGNINTAPVPSDGMNNGSLSDAITAVAQATLQDLQLSLTGLHDISISEEGDLVAMDEVRSQFSSSRSS